ncbi:MAG: fatty acid CoA ligase family protein [Fuerstiella sp.]|nr:fatty acid CoA ligase family protein [Fuerstiella sp.]
MSKSELNIADRLTTSARLVPDQRAIVVPHGRDAAGRGIYSQTTFEQLDRAVDQIARGLIRLGIRPGMRLVLMVPPSLEFIALTFGIFRSGAVCTLIDPGMGRSRIFDCLDEIEPAGFCGIPLVHMIRRLMFRRFSKSNINVCVGRGAGLLGCISYGKLLRLGSDDSIPLPETMSTDPAAIIFTSGSTGPPKGVLYEHGMFDAQVDLIRNRFGIEPGEVDLPGFPLFALFNLAMQVTTVVPDMNPARPADVDPTKILTAIQDQGVTQAFGSPAMWNRIGRYCSEHGRRLPTLSRILSAGAPVPNHVLQRITNALPESADIHTPYGATECLPVAAIGGREVLESTAVPTSQGAGTCVGYVFEQMTVRIVKMTFDPIASIELADELSTGEIGEIIVRGPVATREYYRRPDATNLAKIKDGNTFWHRMGDVGYFDESGRLWFCGRKAHVVFTSAGPMYSVRCEAIFNCHDHVYRSALVGIGERGGQTPIIVVEPEQGRFPVGSDGTAAFEHELRELGASNPLTMGIRKILFRSVLPVDTRHNVKINREQLAVWATTQL